MRRRSYVLAVVLGASACRAKSEQAPARPARPVESARVVAPLPRGSVEQPTAAASSSTPASAAACPDGMLKVPGGKFWVGSDPDERFADDESPRFLTELADFCMDATEVTVAAYARCVERGACTAPERHGFLCNYGRAERATHPINCVTWTDADNYCKAEGARLPSELELEYAARGGDAYLKYPWGDATPDGHACWKHAGTCAVKSYPPGAFGLSDISGNVWEWGAEWYGTYPWPPLTGYSRVYRGGSFSRRFEKWMHTRLRNRLAPDKSGAHLGFRCARTLGACPFGEEAPGSCRRGVLERPCAKDKKFNGVRCVAPGEPRCVEGFREERGHGCVPEVPEETSPEDVEASARAVRRQRSPEFDADCRHNSRDRPNAFRYVGGSHAARTLVSKRAGCKNRDVGVGWNSACCP